MKKISTAIVILNWNGLEDTKSCLRSLLKITGVTYKVIIIDNGSQNNEAFKLERIFDEEIEVHALEENIGFTGGFNYGIKVAQKYHPEYFLLLNNDTEVDKNFLKSLMITASTDARIGIVSPIIYDYENRSKIIFSGGYINWWLGKTFHNTDHIPYKKESKFITGCCLLIKRELIKKVGSLDDRFFADFEDAAYSISASLAGYKCICDPNSIIYHKQGASTEKTGVFKTYLISRNRILFVNNYAPKIVRYYFIIFNLVKLLLVIIIFLTTGQWKRAYAYTKGYIDGTYGRGGRPTI